MHFSLTFFFYARRQCVHASESAPSMRGTTIPFPPLHHLIRILGIHAHIFFSSHQCRDSNHSGPHGNYLPPPSHDATGPVLHEGSLYAITLQALLLSPHPSTIRSPLSPLHCSISTHQRFFFHWLWPDNFLSIWIQMSH